MNAYQEGNDARLYDEKTNLIVACRDGNVARVQELLNSDEDSAVGCNYALRIACEFGQTEVVKILLRDERVDPADWNSWIIRIACDYNHVDIVNLLLQDGRADPTGADNYCIRNASIYGHIKVVQLLLQDGRVDPTARDNMAINQAKTEEIKEMLIKYKYRVDGPEYCRLKESLEK